MFAMTQAVDSTKAVLKSAPLLSPELVSELIKIVPSVLWFGLALLILLIFYKRIRDELLPNLSGFKAMGVEFSFVKDSITNAIEVAEKSPQWKVSIPKEDREHILKRVQKGIKLFRGATLLWIDDVPDAIRNERRMLENLHVEVDHAQSTEEAFERLGKFHYDLILSDIARGEDKIAGLKFLDQYKTQKQRVPVIFYVGTFLPEKGVPPYAFGITHRPDELLHLIMDALERKRA